MTTMRVANDLAEVMVPIGYVGAAIAGACAIVAAVAVIRGSGGLTGGAVGVWIVGALMSFTASFAQQWLPLILACSSLVAMLVIGGVVRAIVNAAGVGRTDEAAADALPRAASTVKPAAVSKPTLATKSAATASIPVVS
ncbi:MULTISPECIES: hypothetical protein [Microbacterium]|uniref:hypothetical protein n=1 Tax=Microbacterium TaxID=33882 RepID=UPI001122D832|nr:MULTISPECIES: hypothetical protein [Microbacterium]MBT2496164.1 hypothetical protein [Microbacterium sp. ISL-59]NJI61103.1 hypothetical protein [Microbacterium sp. B19(2022)]